jgi:hypothetical protein
MVMMKLNRGKLNLMGIVMVSIFLSSVFGCQSVTSTRSTPKQKNAPLYYDFGDVLIPKELKVDKKLSFIYRTAGLTSGVLTLGGRVEVNSLITFFEVNMAKDNWQEVVEFKSPRNLLLFKKENRWCVIKIEEKEWKSYVEIWVAPTMGEMESGLVQ